MVKETFNKILEDIKTVTIQGAENIAKAGIQAYLLSPTKQSAKKILQTRPTEPLLQNMISILEQSTNKEKTAQELLTQIRTDHEDMIKEGIMNIEEDMNIYTHCHSSSVIDLLLFAKKHMKKHFVVYTTEVEPLLQGRMTAKDLSKEGIQVIIGPDLAMEQLLQHCDLALFGADAFSKKSLANKIGTKTLCDLAQHHKIPVYACGIMMKYTKKIILEQRNKKEVWNTKQQKITIKNPAFDEVPYELITGIICEQGTLTTKQFIKEANKKIRELKKR